MTAPAVILASGHMVDAPDRSVPRFPPSEVGRVTAEIAAALAQWGAGPTTLLVCGGARGADLIAAEEALRLGSRVLLCLAQPVDVFEAGSVALPGTNWSERFRAVLGRAEVMVLPAHVDQADGPYAATNRWMLEVARERNGGAAPLALLVWNGQGGDGPGGTKDLIDRLGLPGQGMSRARVVDPSPRGGAPQRGRPSPRA